MAEREGRLEELRATCDALVGTHDHTGRRWAAHAAVLDRLAELQRGAAAAGWTSLAVERDGAGERFRLFGIPPGAALRAEVPDVSTLRPDDGRR